MLCEVIVLMREGKRLKKEELAEPMLALLEVQACTPAPTEARRYGRVANLYAKAGKAKAIFASLLDPELVRTTSDGFVLCGNEVFMTDQGKREVLQMWLCRPAGGKQVPLPGFFGSLSVFAPP